MSGKLTMLLLTLTFSPIFLENVGTYSVEYFYQQNEELSTNGSVTIVGENTEIYHSIAIDAKDFSIKDSTNLTEEMILASSEAKVWNIETLEEYKVERVSILKVNDALYRATIYSFDNISTTININVEKELLSQIDYKRTIEQVAIGLESDQTGVNHRMFTELAVIGVTGITSIGILIFFLTMAYNSQVRKSINSLNKTIINVKDTQH